MNNTDLHQETYNKLADEYEANAILVQSYFNKAMPIFTSMLKNRARVLDVGGGIGQASEFVIDKKNADVIAIELSSNMAGYYKKRNPSAKIVIGDFLSYKFQGKFDGIIMGAFLHLFSDYEVNLILRKCFGLLRAGGIIYLDTTKAEKYKQGYELKSDYDQKLRRFRTRWTKEKMTTKLTEHGFEISSYREITGIKNKLWMVFVVQKTR